MNSITEQEATAELETYEAFWNWFNQNRTLFFETVKSATDIEEAFFNVVSPRLQYFNPEFYCVTGMLDEHTAELIISTDGSIKDFVFAEEMVAAAPAIEGWKFTALKPACGVENSNIEMHGTYFNQDTIRFFPNDNPAYPDEIDITLVHPDYNNDNAQNIKSGCLIFLDNALGELNTAELIDSVDFANTNDVTAELIPAEKLASYLRWRQKEFVEKYEDKRHNSSEDNHTVFEAEDENGLPVIATMNETLLNWDAKASHPWMIEIEIAYNGEATNGMPDDTTFGHCTQFDEQLEEQLTDSNGYLVLGRETYNGSRRIYIASAEFRQCSKIVAALIEEWGDRLDINYVIFKDKYWSVLDRFMQAS